jgi:hypothetical protein
VRLSRRQLIAALSVLVVVVGAGVGVASLRQPAPEPQAKLPVKVAEKPAPEAEPVCPLDGTPLESEAPRALAVMVENDASVRPQAGIGTACVVVEGLSEAGITRFMLVFGVHGAENVGPVRSARTHFVALARGWDSIFGHVGGSIYALDAIKQWGVADWDQMTNPGYERVGWTKAPHNVFTSTEKIRAAAAKYADSGGLTSAFEFKSPAPEADRPEGPQKITIDFSSAAYHVRYEYDRVSNTYKRFNGGQPHVDANTQAQVSPANIVVMSAETNPIEGGSGVLDVTVHGSGPLTVMRDGAVIEGRWEKAGPADPLVLKDESGRTLKLNPGQTWIEIVTMTTAVSVEQ